MQKTREAMQTHKASFNIRNMIITAAFALAASLQVAAATSMEDYIKELSSPKYIEAADLPDPMVFLPPPPGWTSPLFAGDYAAYLWGKSIRPTERGTRAVEQAAFLFDEISAYFSKPFGIEISREKTPAIYKVLYKGAATAMQSYVRAKKSYKRARPFVRYAEGTPFPEEEKLLKDNGSYPSGHTVRGWCLGLLASEINPGCQNELLKLGYEWGESRIIIGYHWKSDVEAARALASAVYARLHTSEEFLADMAAARREFAALTKRQDK
jgi:acid phosphatase (class A)